MDLGNIGESGRVSVKISKGRLGEVVMRLPSGGTQAYPARAAQPDEEIAAGTIVYVDDEVGGILYVMTR